MATTYVSGNGITLRIDYEEVDYDNDGQTELEFTITVIDGPITADIRGLFLDFGNDALLDGLYAYDENGEDLNAQFSADGVVDLGNGANMQGSDEAPFDAGIEIGSEGIGENDIQSYTFILDHDTESLTVEDVADEFFGVRLTSVGSPNSPREGSLKLVGTLPLPPVANPETAEVDEAALDTIQDAGDVAPADTTGTMPDLTTESVSGTLDFSDPDSSVSVTSVEFEGNSVDVPQDGTTTTINGEFGILQIDMDGNYTYTLTTNSLDHTSEGTSADGVSELFGYTVTDPTNLSASSTITVTILDDIVTITAQDDTETLLVDETDFNVDDTQDFSGYFDIDYGADGKGSLDYSLTIDVEGGDSGLVDTLSGDAVMLSMDGGDVVGSVADGEVFRISVDADGLVTLDQSRSVVHPDDMDDNDPISMMSGVVGLTATVTDGDGDSAEASTDVGSKVTFLDDGPDATIAATGTPITLDETEDDGDDTDVDGLLADVTISGAALFTDTSDFGNDGPDDGDAVAAKVYSLGLNDGDTGLTDTVSGEAVVLSEDNGDIVGSTELGGLEVFRISVADNGDVTVTQTRAIVHDNPNDPDEASEPEMMAGGLVDFIVTVTDGDGDVDSDSFDLGTLIKFEDDGPTIDTQADEEDLEVDETDFGTDDTADFSGNFTSSFGSDGPATADSIVYDLTIDVEGGDSGLVDTLSGDAVMLSMDGGDVVGSVADGEVFRISVDADGLVTLDQSRSVVHPDDMDDNDPISMMSGVVGLTATVTDGDGDSAEASTDVGSKVTFLDDGPTISAPGDGTELEVDETDFSTDDTADFSGSFNHAAGADGLGSVSYSFVVDGGPSGLTDTLSGSAVVLTDESGVIVGRTDDADGFEVFSLSVDGAGNVTLDQSRAVVHSDGTDPDDAISLAAGAVSLMATITDGDGDSADASLDMGGAVTFRDDGPSVEVLDDDASLLVDESDLNTDDDGVDFSGYFGAVDYGADGPPQGGGDTTYALTISAEGVDSGLNDTATGSDILLYTDGTGTVEGRVGGEFGAVAFVVTMDTATAVLDFDQIRAVVHPDVNSDNEPVNLSEGVLAVTAFVEDGDGDLTGTDVDLGTKITILDDGVEITGIQDGLVEQFNMVNTTSGDIQVDFGNDGASDINSLVFSDVDLSDVDIPEGMQIVGGLGTDTLVLSTNPLDPSDPDATTITFEISPDADGEGDSTSDWTVTIDQPPLVPNETSLSFVNPGAPQEIVSANEGGDANLPILVDFDGIFIESFDDFNPLAAGNIINPVDNDVDGYSSTDDDLNANQVGFGDRAGQDSNYEEFGGFIADPTSDNAVGFRFTVDGIGNNNDAKVHWAAYDDTNGNGVLDDGDQLVDYGTVLADELAGANKKDGVVIQLTPDEVMNGEGADNNGDGLGDFLEEFDFMVVWFEMDSADSNNGEDDKDNNTIRVQDFVLLTNEDVPDFEIDVTVTATDGDGDTDDDEFTVIFDGNDAGVF